MKEGSTPRIRIFISSPGDVTEERELALRVIERLQGWFSGLAHLEALLWEDAPLLASADFQSQISPPSEADVVAFILWSRLGTPLPEGIQREDGSRYRSGTEWEFEDAIRSHRERGLPDLLVYRKMADPLVNLRDAPDALAERIRQWKSVEGFFATWFRDEAEESFTAAFHPFRTPAEFAERLEAHLSACIERRLTHADEPAGGARWRASPYRGLKVFEPEHARIFFGRTRAIHEVLQALRDQTGRGSAFVLVLGMSGCGKSSLLRAGLLPLLSAPRIVESEAGPGVCRHATFRPAEGAGLFEALAAALLAPEALPSLGKDEQEAGTLAETLRESPKAAVALIRQALRVDAPGPVEAGGRKTTARLVLLVDQLEEMFTRSEPDDETRHAFVSLLDTWARSGHVWVLASLRSDFYPRLIDFPELMALKEGAGQYDLAPPTTAELQQMIRQPAQVAGLLFETHPDTRQSLDQVLLDAGSRDPTALPLLQFALEQIYDRRDGRMLTFAAYEALHGVEGALAMRAEEVFGGLDAKARAAFPPVMRALVDVGVGEGEPITRRSVSIDETQATDAARRFVTAFVEARLFTADTGRDGRPVVRMTHEALLRAWPRLHAWIEQNRELLRARSRVVGAAKRWRAEGEPPSLLLPEGRPLVDARHLQEAGVELAAEDRRFVRASLRQVQKAKRIRQVAVAVIVLLGLVSIVLAVFAIKARDEALTQKASAEEARDRAVTAEKTTQRKAEEARRASSFMYDVYGMTIETLRQEGSLNALQSVLRHVGVVGRTKSIDTPDFRRVLALTNEAEADLYYAEGNHEAALNGYQNALAIRSAMEERTDADPYGARSRIALHRAIADVLRVLRRYDEAEEALDAGMRLAVARLERSPYDTLAQRELSEVRYALGLLRSEQGRLEEAWALYEQVVETQRDLAGKSMADLRLPQDMAHVLSTMAALRERQGRLEEAATLRREAADFVRDALPLLPQYRDLLVGYEERAVVAELLAGSREPATSLDHLRLAKAYQDRRWFDRALPRYEEVMRDEGLRHDPPSWILYNAAVVAGALSVTQSDVEAATLRGRAIRWLVEDLETRGGPIRALVRRGDGAEALAAARANILDGYARVIEDPAGPLAPLREDPRFQEVIAVLRSLYD